MITYTEKDYKQDLELIKNIIDNAFETILSNPDLDNKFLSNEMFSDLLELNIEIKTAARKTIEIIEKVEMMRSQKA